MGTPATRKTIDVSGAEIREIRDKIRQANIDIAAMEAYRDGLVAKVKKRMGKAEEMKIDGVLAFTYAPTKGYSWARFATEHGDIADRYKIKVEKEELDKEGLLRDHAGLLAPFQTKQFLIK